MKSTEEIIFYIENFLIGERKILNTIEQSISSGQMSMLHSTRNRIALLENIKNYALNGATMIVCKDKE